MSQDTTTTTDQEPVQALETTEPETPETQAVQAEEKSADTNQTSEVEETTTEDQTGTSDENAEILEWAEKKGIKTDDPVAILKMARESETKMHSATQEAKQLRNTVQTIGENEGYDEQANLINRLKVTDFYLNNPEAKVLDAEMAKIVEEKPHLANDLESVFEIATARTSKRVTQEQIEASRKEKLAQVTKSQLAAPPNTSATTRETPKQVTDEDIAKMTPAEYVEFKKNTGFDPFAM